MKRHLLVLSLALAVSALPLRAAYTEAYVQTTGSNLNAGILDSGDTGAPDDAASVTLTGGNWVAATGVFTSSGSDLSSIAVGEFASVYASGATETGFVGRITAVDDTLDTVTVSLSAVSGTPPADGTGNRALKVGGAWAGPSGAVDFPIGFAAGTMVNTAGDPLRVNYKSGTDYSISATMTADIAGPVTHEGYTTTVGDGGRAEFDGGEPATSFTLISVTAAQTVWRSFIFNRNGSAGTGTGDGFSLASTAAETIVDNIVVHTIRRRGIDMGTADNTVLSYSEVYACNVSNSSAESGIRLADVTATVIGCVSHDNAGANSNGFTITSGAAVLFCMADSNGANGFLFSATAGTALVSGIDAYNNTGDGASFSGGSAVMIWIENSNFIDNGGWGLASATQPRTGIIRNCGFGSGTAANGSGAIDTDLAGISQIGTITYATDVTPWADPANGDFDVILTAAKGTGFRSFVQTQASYGGTLGYPDVGASQHQDAGGSSEHSYISGP